MNVFSVKFTTKKAKLMKDIAMINDRFSIVYLTAMAKQTHNPCWFLHSMQRLQLQSVDYCLLPW